MAQKLEVHIRTVRKYDPTHKAVKHQSMNNEEVFLKKQQEIIEISTFLQHDSQTRFQIELEDKEGHSIPYDMTGPPE